MNTRVIISIILISLGSIAAILPKKDTSSLRLDARELHREIKLGTYKVTPDELADRLINEDPSIQLIDLRSKEEYELYHLPGAINIPLDSLLSEKWRPYVDQISNMNIFYSNSTILAGEAVILTRQMGMKNNFQLEGGLNGWFSTIIQPEPPELSAPREEWEKYETRMAARQYFTGSGAVKQEEAAPALPPVPRRKKTRVQGGCS